jgi:hypothetical protein
MKYFLIRYHFTNGSQTEWHQEIGRFIAALESDPSIGGKISYRAMRTAKGDYYHIAAAVDEPATQELGERDFFERYTQETHRVGGGQVTVEPLEIVAETKFLA